jgi:hypothetical protein
MSQRRDRLGDLPESFLEGLGPDVGAFGLTQKEVDRLRQIIAKETGVALSNREAWARAIELVAFARLLLKALPPKDVYSVSSAVGVKARRVGVTPSRDSCLTPTLVSA